MKGSRKQKELRERFTKGLWIFARRYYDELIIWYVFLSITVIVANGLIMFKCDELILKIVELTLLIVLCAYSRILELVFFMFSESHIRLKRIYKKYSNIYRVISCILVVLVVVKLIFLVFYFEECLKSILFCYKIPMYL